MHTESGLFSACYMEQDRACVCHLGRKSDSQSDRAADSMDIFIAGRRKLGIIQRICCISGTHVIPSYGTSHLRKPQGRDEYAGTDAADGAAALLCAGIFLRIYDKGADVCIYKYICSISYIISEFLQVDQPFSRRICGQLLSRAD